jgi:lysozyme family protein
MADFDLAIDQVLFDEGGLEINSLDPAGITNWGISLRFYKTIKPDAIDEDIKNLTKDEAKQIYLKYFWNPNHYNMITNQKLATKVFDIAINISALKANKLLQMSANNINNYHELSAQYLDIDGILGPRSLYTINYAYQIPLYDEFIKNVVSYYYDLTQHHLSFSHFIDGWIRRAKQ